MKTLLLLALLLPAQMPSPPCAAPMELVIAQVHAAVPQDKLILERVTGRAVGKPLQAINDMEPQTDFSADTILVVYWKGMPVAVVILFLDGCSQAQIQMPAADARRLFGGEGI